ncbi:16357_t:CDS:2 [Funneliformis geosporum]|uniref:9755_t:CDS:1 n=1 Tax=Funneliformis geosporum TaxID=1117311 RepID=A0A9W4X0S4_9GLOM|nr:16357_t:CDS:2 [Funneliformis geosporum]CAI2177963.1 9755_t:CDS:2 [Funneliformis geosporum]
MDQKINLTSTLKSNSPIDTSTIINNNNIEPKFLLSSNFESNHFFTESQGITFADDERATHQNLIHNWMLPIFSLPTPHLSIQSNINNTNIFMNHPTPSPTSTCSDSISTIPGSISFAQPLDSSQSTCSTSVANPTTTSQRNNSTSPTTRNRHECDWPGCTWSFKRLEHLKRHMITHTGERKYTCNYPGCGKRFGRSDNFAAHFRTHNKTNPRRSRGTAKSSNKIQFNNLIDTRQIQTADNNGMSLNLMHNNPISQNTVTQELGSAYSLFCDDSKDKRYF